MNYSKRKKQLEHILKDKNYWGPNSDGFKEFLFDMHQKVRNGHDLSEKQEAAVTKAVKRYAGYFFKKNDPKYKAKLDGYVDNIQKIRRLMYECNYSNGYIKWGEDFLNSVESQVKRVGYLSLKQKQALNKMHKRFRKKIDK